MPELQVVRGPRQQPLDRGVHVVGQHVGGRKVVPDVSGNRRPAMPPATSASLPRIDHEAAQSIR